MALRALACGRHGRAGRARGRAGDAPAARQEPGDGPVGRTPAAGRPAARAAQRRHHARRARARLARCQRRPRAARPLRAGAGRRGARARSTGMSTPSAEALAGAGIEPVVLRAKEGLALINGTDGILGMLSLAITDLEVLARLADVTAAMTRRGAARHRPRVRRRSAGAAAAGRAGRQRGQPAPPARRFGDRRQPSRRRPPGAGRLLAAVHAAGARRRARHHGPRPHDRRPRARRRDRQPDDPARRPGRVVRQLPRRTARLRAATSSPSPWRSCRRSASAAPTGCSTPPDRTACRRSCRPTQASTSGMMIAHYTQAAMATENQRLAVPASVDSLPTSAMQEDHVSMAGRRRASCAQRSPTCAGCWPSSWCARRVRSTCARRSQPAAGTGAAVGALRERRRRRRAGPVAVARARCRRGAAASARCWPPSSRRSDRSMSSETLTDGDS